ncbi:DUF6531 domain-containing protein [Achromobacter seleniivolatilans]|uniref:DUF6531 domain-containing protein n=1 Tax=Achromobacter seleniivolatilans TaxID=3047478 RepID=A0ABY9LZK2_9BURK|nr:DUF6531 domain-containing protein [Achromobacter sp. R39]WMD20198.1 DUF6531 domain-containing protein [Achromobacter sp. R39]
MKARTFLLTASLCLASLQSVADDAPPPPTTPPPTSPPAGTVMDSSGPFVATEPVNDLPSPEEPIPLTEEMISLEDWQAIHPTTGLYPEDVEDPEQNLGEPDSQSCAGNPINIATGNKFQEETDIAIGNRNTLELVRYYNSQRAVHWSHTYSVYIKKEGAYAGLKTAEGSTLKFIDQGGSYTPLNNFQSGTLRKIGTGWEHKNVDQDISRFDDKGRLIQWMGHTGYGYSIAYSGNSTTVTDIYQKTLHLNHDAFGRLSGASNAWINATYRYDKGGRLIGVTYNYSGKIKGRSYGYEDSRLPFHLTSITDERGIVSSTWTYDARGRAISSTHANGADKTTLAYDDLGTTVVTNPLGKQSTHVFQTINNVKRVVRVDGHPSLNCGMSNAQFKYDTQGRLTEKIADNGAKTTYSYNAQGFEISRTEAAGTPLARTTTTQRDTDGVKPITITQPGKKTEYRYNAKGQVTEVSVQ